MLDPATEDPLRNPIPWFRPLPVMWLCIVICIALIVVGSLLNRRAAALADPADPVGGDAKPVQKTE